jgi:hypothetical protein
VRLPDLVRASRHAPGAAGASGAARDRALHPLTEEGRVPQLLSGRLGFRIWGRVVSFTGPRAFDRPGTGGEG